MSYSETYAAVVLGERPGHVAVAVGYNGYFNERGTYTHPRGQWVETRFAWPDQANALRTEIEQLLDAGEAADVYICPAVRHTDQRRQGDALPPMVCWADLDDEPKALDLLDELDGYIVASGQPGHRHIYVPLSEPVPLGVHKQLNQALAGRLGGDAKWSDESLLRMPGTRNHKTAPPALVTEPDAFNGRTWHPHALAELLDVDLDAGDSGTTGGRHLTLVTPAAEPPPDPLPGKVRKALETPETDRSVAHARLVSACYDTGLSQGQAVAVASSYGPSRDKYGDKVPDEVARWWSKVGEDRPQPTPLSTMTDGSAALATAPAAELDQHRGQVRIAYRLVAEHGGRLRYAHGLGWHVWDGTRWAPDVDGEPWRAVMATTRTAMREAITLDKDARDALLADVRKAESATGARGVLDLAAAMKPVAVPAAALDADPYLFTCANGTLDLRTGELRAADPADLITKVAGCAYEPDATSTTFTSFLATVLPDDGVRDFLQRVCGYALLGEVREHVLPICSGTGRNGKGTLLDAVRKAFGDYGMSVQPELLMESGPQHSTEQTDLRGARFVTTSETNQGRPLAAATVKRLTGGDPIRARRMRQDTIQFEPSHTLAMMTNFKPTVSGDDPAMWRRIRVIPFDVTIDEAAADAGLPAALAAELPAVLAWCVEGYRRYLVDGLSAPDAVTARTDEYRVANDALGRFLDERTIAAQFGTATAGEMYSAWSAWCAANGETAGTRNTFADAMARHGHASRKSHGRMIYSGLVLTTEGDNEVSPND